MKSSYYDKSVPVVVPGRRRGLAHWLPSLIVLTVLGGFISLSWYAYHAGTSSGREEDLLVIEADKTPIKEKPTDPGGMHFPNQDKTIFDTFANNAPVPLKVERVLPGPEEPMARDADMSDTDSWINDKLQHHDQEANSAPAASPNMSVAKSEKTPDLLAVIGDEDKRQHQLIKANSSSGNEMVTYLAAKKEPPAIAAPVPTVTVTTPIEAPAPKEAVKEAKARPLPQSVLKPSAAPHEAATGSSMVQLGAYRSDHEARQAWDKMRAKHKELSGKKLLVAKADLGAKGTYYRLRIAGLAQADAKSLCKSLAATGQACVLTAGK